MITFSDEFPFGNRRWFAAKAVMKGTDADGNPVEIEGTAIIEDNDDNHSPPETRTDGT